MKIHQILINDTNKLPNKFPDFHNTCYKQIKNLYPNDEYHLYSGENLEEIIKNNFHNDVFIAYKKLKPYACKADLGRLCLLYLYGGLYIDLNLYFINKIPDLDKYEFFAFRDHSKMSKQSWALQNSIIYSLPNSKIIKNAINIIIENCKNEYYGIECVNVSSTTVLGTSVARCWPSLNISTRGELDYLFVDKNLEKIINDLQFFDFDKKKVSGFIMDDDNKLISIRKLCDGGDIQSLGFEGTNNYVKMWENKDVYDDKISFSGKIIPKYN